MPSDATYCAITFAPVQGFIEKSRKLRDLYGSSFILSYLAATVCNRAKQQGWTLISPALPDITKGTPNQIVLQVGVGAQRLRPSEAATLLQTAFNEAWVRLVIVVRENLESTTPSRTENSSAAYAKWQRSWELWGRYAWEWFCIIGQPGESITQVRQQLNEAKRSRNWIGVNWQGESSTLSGMDAIAWPEMDCYDPKAELRSERDQAVDAFYANLSRRWSGKMIDAEERLSIPDLVKRCATLREVAQKLELDPTDYPNIEAPERFTDLNRLEAQQYTAWFMGDGDKIGDYLKRLEAEAQLDEAIALNQLSTALTKWGDRFGERVQDTLQAVSPLLPESRVIYAGGDDFLGVLYRTDEQVKLQPSHWLPWLYQFQALWKEHGYYFVEVADTDVRAANSDLGASVAPLQSDSTPDLTVSMGLVWAAPGVPQREVLQHCRAAEKSAKSQGRNRVALRILFNSGTHLEWACPWDWLEPILNGGCNWVHFQRDIATLQARHALEVPPTISEADVRKHTTVAIAILQHHLQLSGEAAAAIADGKQWREQWFNGESHTGILGERDRFKCNKQRNRWSQVAQAFNNWVIALANVGFRLAPGAQQPTQTESIAA